MKNRGKKGKTEKQIFDKKNREDVIHILENLWFINPEDAFYKIFYKKTKNGINQIICNSDKNLLKLEWKEEN